MAKEVSGNDRLPSSADALRRSLRHGFRAEPKLLVVAGVISVFAAAIDALFALGLAFLADAVEVGAQSRIVVFSIVLALVVSGNWLFQVGGDRLNRRLTERASVYMESHVARLQASIGTLEHHERVDYLDRLSLLRNHAPALSQLYGSLFNTAGAIVRLMLTLGLLISVSPVLIVLGVFAIPTLLVSNWRGGVEHKAREKLGQEERRARQMLLIGSSPTQNKEIKVARLGTWLRDRRGQVWDDRYRTLARVGWVSSFARGGSMALFGVALVGAAAYVGTRSNSSAGELMLVLVAGGRLSQYVGQAASDMHFFRTIWLDGSRRLAWLEDYASVEWSGEQTPPNKLSHGIVFEHVSFKYPGTEKLVLEDANFSIPAGKVVAIVGQNGAGKSTLVKLICGYYHPTQGRILVDGMDLSDFDLPAWRQSLSGAFQDFFMFEYPMQQSVGLGHLPEIENQEKVTAALARAGASQLVEQLPLGINTQLGVTWQSGSGLSHGQWQRVALARGFMRESPLVLVLDEPASALDAETEHALFERFAHGARNQSRFNVGGVTILVSHRFSTVKMADLIIVIEGSTVAEIGNHEELLALGGIYEGLFNLQAQAYR